MTEKVGIKKGRAYRASFAPGAGLPLRAGGS